MAQTIKFRRGNAVNFGSVNLVAGEPAFVLDTGKLYIGDGTNKICINPDIPEQVTAERLKTARDIILQGAVTGSVAFDGSQNVNIATTLADSGVTPGTYAKVTVTSKGIVTAGEALTSEDIPPLSHYNITDLGTAALMEAANAPYCIPYLGADGKLDASVLPALALTETFVVGSQAEMLALNLAGPGDICVRTDEQATYILKVLGASVLSNWQKLATPTDAVSSVAGKTGAVSLVASDVGLGNVTNESKYDMFTNPAFMGIPTAPTAGVGVNTTQLATTAYVVTAVNNKTTITGNAGSATKLQTARTFTFTGDITGSFNFDGSANPTCTLALGAVDGGTF